VSEWTALSGSTQTNHSFVSTSPSREATKPPTRCNQPLNQRASSLHSTTTNSTYLLSTPLSLTDPLIHTHSPSLTHSLTLIHTHSQRCSLAHCPSIRPRASFVGQLTVWRMLVWKLITQSLTRSRTHALTHSRTHALTHSLTHSLTASLAHSLTASLVRSSTHPLSSRR